MCADNKECHSIHFLALEEAFTCTVWGNVSGRERKRKKKKNFFCKIISEILLHGVLWGKRPSALPILLTALKCVLSLSILWWEQRLQMALSSNLRAKPWDTTGDTLLRGWSTSCHRRGDTETFSYFSCDKLLKVTRKVTTVVQQCGVRLLWVSAFVI